SPAGPPPTMATSIIPGPLRLPRAPPWAGARQRGEKRGRSATPDRRGARPAPPAGRLAGRGLEVVVRPRPAAVAGAHVLADARMQPVVGFEFELRGHAGPAAARVRAPGIDHAAAGTAGRARQGAGVVKVARTHAALQGLDQHRARRFQVARDLVDEGFAV